MLENDAHQCNIYQLAILYKLELQLVVPTTLSLEYYHEVALKYQKTIHTKQTTIDPFFITSTENPSGIG